MLKNALISLRAARPGLAHVSLFFVGLMWVLPFHHPRHQYPLTTFDQEWWSALLGVFALTLLAARDFWQQPKIPRIAQLPVGLIAILLLQMALHKVAYFDQGLLYILYLLFAALLMLLGARLRTCFGLEKVATVLAIFLLIGAESSALIGVLQHFRWNTPLSQVIAQKTSGALFGNLAQPNHYANYIALGLISLGLLFQQRKLKLGYVAVLAVPLLFVMTLSGSRSPWLYLLLMSGLAWWASRRDARQRSLLRYCLLLIMGFGLMHLIVKLPFMAGPAGSVDNVQRLFDTGATGSVRLYLWRESWLIFTQSPWLGVGFGQFAWHHFQMLPVLRPAYDMGGLYNNAHNLVCQIAVEAGLSGLLVLFASLGVWLHGMRRVTLDAARWWGYAALGVLATHSLLEYPLWYTYFVAVAAILLGILDEAHYYLELRRVGRMSLVAILLLGLMTLVQLRGSYQQLKGALAIRPVSGVVSVAEAFQRARDGLVAAHGKSLLTPYVEVFMGGFTDISTGHLGVKLELNDRIMHYIPTQAVVYRQAFLLAQNGQIEQAKQLLEQAIWSYPSHVNEYKQLALLAEKDPAHFSALLEFALQKEQEYRRAVHRQ